MPYTNLKIILTMKPGTERDALVSELTEMEHNVHLCIAGNELWSYLNENPEPHVLMLDTDVSGADTEELLEAIHAKKMRVCTLLLTDERTANMAAVWAGLGAWAYMLKPVHWGRLAMHLDRMREYFGLQDENAGLHAMLADCAGAGAGTVFRSPAMLKTLEEIRFAAVSNSPVLITGEPGTDKTAIALEIHNTGRNRHAAFISYNPLEQQRGDQARTQSRGPLWNAMTGASGGTLYINEISALPPTDQETLLSEMHAQKAALESEEDLRRRGEFRLIASSSVNMALEVGRGAFSGELFNMLSRKTIALPPLRERAEDIPALARRYLELSSPDPLKPKTLAGSAVDILVHYHWQGNERELKNVIERAALHSTEPEIQSEDILNMLSLAAPKEIEPPAAAPPSAAGFSVPSLELKLEELEKAFITSVLEKFDFHRENTAASLGISRKTLYLKIKEYGIRRSDKLRLKS